MPNRTRWLLAMMLPTAIVLGSVAWSRQQAISQRAAMTARELTDAVCDLQHRVELLENELAALKEKRAPSNGLAVPAIGAEAERALRLALRDTASDVDAAMVAFGRFAGELAGTIDRNVDDIAMLAATIAASAKVEGELLQRITAASYGLAIRFAHLGVTADEAADAYVASKGHMAALAFFVELGIKLDEAADVDKAWDIVIAEGLQGVRDYVEPTYQGKPASEWIKLSRDHDSTTREHAEYALIRLQFESHAAQSRLDEVKSDHERNLRRMIDVARSGSDPMWKARQLHAAIENSYRNYLYEEETIKDAIRTMFELAKGGDDDAKRLIEAYSDIYREPVRDP